MKSKIKILIVDDEPIIRDALSFKLTKEGYEVSAVEDGEKAIEAMEDEEYDMIISDVMMPYINGFELIKILKEQGTEAPILMLTSLNSDKALNRAKDLGADDFMTKPFSPSELSIRIKKLLKK